MSSWAVALGGDGGASLSEPMRGAVQQARLVAPLAHLVAGGSWHCSFQHNLLSMGPREEVFAGRVPGGARGRLLRVARQFRNPAERQGCSQTAFAESEPRCDYLGEERGPASPNSELVQGHTTAVLVLGRATQRGAAASSIPDGGAGIGCGPASGRCQSPAALSIRRTTHADNGRPSRALAALSMRTVLRPCRAHGWHLVEIYLRTRSVSTISASLPDISVSTHGLCNDYHRCWSCRAVISGRSSRDRIDTQVERLSD
jgi:hypothetical protein